MDFADIPVRIARPSSDLDAMRRFWVEGLGLDVLWEAGADAEGDHALLMVGPREASWHLELVEDPSALADSPPGTENLLVLYLAAAVHVSIITRLTECGGTRVLSPNPYWNQSAETIADPDGYRLVLCSRRWAPRPDVTTSRPHIA